MRLHLKCIPNHRGPGRPLKLRRDGIAFSCDSAGPPTYQHQHTPLYDSQPQPYHQHHHPGGGGGGFSSAGASSSSGPTTSALYGVNTTDNSEGGGGAYPNKRFAMSASAHATYQGLPAPPPHHLHPSLSPSSTSSSLLSSNSSLVDHQHNNLPLLPTGAAAAAAAAAAAVRSSSNTNNMALNGLPPAFILAFVSLLAAERVELDRARLIL